MRLVKFKCSPCGVQVVLEREPVVCRSLSDRLSLVRWTSTLLADINSVAEIVAREQVSPHLYFFT